MIGLDELQVYKMAREVEQITRNSYQKFDINSRILVGNQFMRAIDSIAANIAEGFGRFHYADSIKFYYYARGSLFESKHRTDILGERKLIQENRCKEIKQKLELLGIRLNNFISTIKEHQKISTNHNKSP